MAHVGFHRLEVVPLYSPVYGPRCRCGALMVDRDFDRGTVERGEPIPFVARAGLMDVHGAALGRVERGVAYGKPSEDLALHL